MATRDDLDQLRVDAETAVLRRLIESAPHNPGSQLHDMAAAVALLRTAPNDKRSGKVTVL